MHAGVVGLIGVAELAVYLVGVDVEVVLACDVAELLYLVPGVEDTGGVAGVADDDALGPGGDVALELLDGGNCETVVYGCGDGHEPYVVDDGEGVVVGVERLQYYNLVVGVAGDGEGYLQGLGAACRDVDVGIVHVDSEILIVAGQAFAVGFVACGVGVGDELEMILLYGIQGFHGRFDVGLAYVEMIDLYASFLCRIGVGHQFADR